MSELIKFYFKPKRLKSRIKAKYYIPKRQKHALTFKAVCVFIIFVIIFILIDIALRPTVKENAAFVVKNEMTGLINECVSEYLENENISYNDLVTVTKTASGEISAVSANAVNVNKLKSGITKAITEELAGSKGEKIKVPVSNLLNSYLLNGKGIKVKIKLTGYGYVETDIVSEFESGGINQTLHRIYIDVNLSVNTNVGTLRTTETIKTTVLLAETVLVGNVPGVYLN